MLSQQPTKVSVSTFGNDSNDIRSKDELIALLIHYGYLGFDAVNQKAFIPNSEVRQELMLAIKNGSRPELVKMVKDSEMLLQKTMEGDGEYVGHHFEVLHSSKSAPRYYNNEQALRSVIHLAYIAAVDDYVQIQELPSGTGYADVVFIPRRGSERPAMVVELKVGGCTSGAIEQIKDRKYPTLVSEFTGNMLLVGINYDKKTKKHECRIERWGESLSLSLSRKDLVTKLSLSIDQVGLLMESLQKPLSAKELRSLLGFKDSTYFKRNVIDVLSRDGLITMTQPDKPTSPTQKYYLTEKGKNL